MKILVKNITALDTIFVRSEVLRKGKPVETCIFEGDYLKTTFHLGLFENQILIGVLSVFKNKNVFFSTNNQLQFRGMAILETHQGKSLGKLLIDEALKISKKMQTETVWFNARESAVNFYLKNNFIIEGNAFEIENIGKHYLMYTHF